MPGLGSCTARQLATGGILTLGQLRKANLAEVMTEASATIFLPRYLNNIRHSLFFVMQLFSLLGFSCFFVTFICVFLFLTNVSYIVDMAIS